MKDLEKQLALISLAIRATDEQLAELMKNNVITSEEFLKINDDRRDKTTEFLEKRRDELIFLIQVEEDRLKQKQEEVALKREQSKQAAKEKTESAKQAAFDKSVNAKESAANTGRKVKDKVKGISEKDKKKGKKIGIVAIVVIVLLLIAGNIMGYLFNNVIGFTDIDLSDEVVMYYDANQYAVEPSFVGNWDYYNESGYYDDEVSKLVETGIYTQEEAEAFIPSYDQNVAMNLGEIITGYDRSTNEELSNGDTIELTFNYDPKVAKSKKINITNNIVEFEIVGLIDPISTSEITSSITDKFKAEDEFKDMILDDIPSMYIDEDTKVEVSRDKVYLQNPLAFDDTTSQTVVQLYTYEVSGVRNNNYSSGHCGDTLEVTRNEDKIEISDSERETWCENSDINDYIEEYLSYYDVV